MLINANMEKTNTKEKEQVYTANEKCPYFKLSMTTV